jgi:hypothetical protein
VRAPRYVTNGGVQGEAAIAASYSDRSGDSIATKLMRIPLIQQAILRATPKRIGLLAGPALQTVERLSAGGKSEYVSKPLATSLMTLGKPPERVRPTGWTST